MAIRLCLLLWLIPVERALAQRFPGIKIASNDVSLLSCALGALLTGAAFPLTFTGRLAFMEDALAGKPFVARVAAVQVALELSAYRRDNDWAKAHFAYYREAFPVVLDAAIKNVEKIVAETPISSFFAGDFRHHAERAIADGGGIAAFPPTYKAGYEKLYQFVDENTEWQRPEYRVWDPSDFGAWLGCIARAGAPYAILSDHVPDGHEPKSVYRRAVGRPVFVFTSFGTTSVRRVQAPAAPFKYVAIDPDALHRDSTVDVRSATSKQMRFLKDVYLAKSIVPVDGDDNFLVFIDGALAGGMIYKSKPLLRKVGEWFVLLDFSTTRARKVSKLIAMIAANRCVVHRVEVRHVWRIDAVLTAVFTDKPISMKYRGIYDLVHRDDGFLTYASKVREQTIAETYREWWDRFARNADPTRQSRRPEAARQECALHEGRAVPAPG